MREMDHRRPWEAGFTWEDYLETEAREHRELWHGVWQRARLSEGSRERATRLPGGWKLLIVTEDWCGDAVNTVPVLARLAAEAGAELRVLKRDEHPELMEGYLTGGSRSIPIAIVLDAAFRPVGHWGPRPAELQAFVLREKAAGVRPAKEIYRDVRSWYARDRGESTAREVLDVVERGTRSEAA